MTEEQIARVRALNDALRQGHISGRILLTSGVAGRGDAFVAQAVAAVSAFDDFTPDNDPYGEHDFGAFDVCGAKLFWKIDYYDLTDRFAADDPSDPASCHRVLTVMLADEY